MPNLVHQGAHKGLWLDDFVTLRRAHPEHYRRRRPPARIVGIEEPVQLAARVAWPDAANLDAHRRGAEQAAYLSGQRASAGGGGGEVAGFERAHQRVHRIAGGDTRYDVEALDLVTFEVGTLRARREPIEKRRKSRLGTRAKCQASRHRTSICRILTSGASSTSISSTQ